jgi:hypothetical protein
VGGLQDEMSQTSKSFLTAGSVFSFCDSKPSFIPEIIYNIQMVSQH